ncbi:MAG: succinylglutamate desuccinylase/aspartoacylase family protein [Pseudomonadales bacterium]|nr:succinylglutamate desuccinylase/aspartoacylase family protein [Pseudomonadales bacterium]
MIDLGTLHYLENPTLEDIGRTPDEFLNKLSKPTLIKVKGKDATRTRALATLLHGNEPSGFFAVHRWLTQQEKPSVNILCFIGGIYPAKTEPVFSHRQLPNGKDLNRCFKVPFEGEEGAIAKAFLDILHEEQPECLIDIHNTSGTGPSFGVTVKNDAEHQALTSLFTERLIVTDLRLGALMEYSEKEVPTVTIECGGAQDEHAHQSAYEGLMRYVSKHNILSLEQAEWGIEILTNPVRIEIKPECTIEFETAPTTQADITLPPDIEHLNFGVTTPDHHLGWLGVKGLDCFTVKNQFEEDITHKILRLKEGKIYPAQSIKAFMITTNPSIAKSDCLFYAVTDKGEQIV